MKDIYFEKNFLPTFKVMKYCCSYHNVIESIEMFVMQDESITDKHAKIVKNVTTIHGIYNQ